MCRFARIAMNNTNESLLDGVFVARVEFLHRSGARPCERLASLGIIKAPLRLSWYPSNITTLSYREASVSRHHEGSIKGPPDTSQRSRHHGTEGFKGTLNKAPIIPRGVVLSHTQCTFSQSEFLTLINFLTFSLRRMLLMFRLLSNKIINQSFGMKTMSCIYLQYNN